MSNAANGSTAASPEPLHLGPSRAALEHWTAATPPPTGGRGPTGGGRTVLLAGIQELFRENPAVEQMLQPPRDLEPGRVQNSLSEVSMGSRHPERVLHTLCGVG